MLWHNRTIDRMRQHREELLGNDDAPEVADDAPTPAAEASQERQRLERLEPQQGRAVREAFSPARPIANWRKSPPCRSAR